MFHVPEPNRVTPDDNPMMGSYSDIGNNGAFLIASPEPGWMLYLICSDGLAEDAVGELADWQHVSVAAHRLKPQAIRIPTWREMVFVKKLCWDAEDCVVQYHPAERDYVNHHPCVLHLWRWTKGVFPTPPKSAV